MKIAIISNHAFSLLNFRGPLLIEMVKRGHDVFAFAPDHSNASRQALEEMGVESVDYTMSRAGANFINEIGVIFSLWRLLKHHQPDLCFSYFIKPVIYGTIAAWAAGVKHRFGMIEGLGFAFTRTSGRNLRRSLLQKIIIFVARFSMKGIERLILLNSEDIDELVANHVIPYHKTALLGGIGVDLSEWAQVPMLDGRLTFILVARLLRDKGIEEYVAAARILKESNSEVQFVLLGGLDDNPSAITQAEVEAWVDEGLIEWPGHVGVKPWLQKAHVFVLPSYYREGLPRSTQEAMALGRPVITTDVPGCRETVIDGLNGFIVSPRDPVALACAMQNFVKNPSIIPIMGQQSRQMAEERFDVDIQNDKLLSLIGL